MTKRDARRDALAYAAGAIVGTGALGAVLLAIRAGGSAAGWAFQLQDPRTDPGADAARHRASRSTCSGCSAVPVARRASAARPVASHRRARGLCRHAVRRPVPRRGAGHRTAASADRIGRWCSPRSGLALRCPSSRSRSFPRFATGCPSPVRGWSGCSAFSPSRWRRPPSRACGCCGASEADRAAGWAGRVGGYWRSAWSARACCSARASCPATGLAMAAVAVAVARGLGDAATRAIAERAIEGVEHMERSGGRATRCARVIPVFVYFTADWCLTCKVNEAAAIDRAEVQRRVPRGRRARAGRRLDQRRSGDHPLPREPRPRRACRSICGTNRARSQRNCRRS